MGDRWDAPPHDGGGGGDGGGWGAPDRGAHPPRPGAGVDHSKTDIVTLPGGRAAPSNLPEVGSKGYRATVCKFWLKGLPCENREKEQGCGFAHGEHELQPKSGLNEKYLTSVCKNFLEHPSKCTYGDRCIF